MIVWWPKSEPAYLQVQFEVSGGNGLPARQVQGVRYRSPGDGLPKSGCPVVQVGSGRRGCSDAPGPPRRQSRLRPLRQGSRPRQPQQWEVQIPQPWSCRGWPPLGRPSDQRRRRTRRAQSGHPVRPVGASGSPSSQPLRAQRVEADLVLCPGSADRPTPSGRFVCADRCLPQTQGGAHERCWATVGSAFQGESPRLWRPVPAMPAGLPPESGRLLRLVALPGIGCAPVRSRPADHGRVRFADRGDRKPSRLCGGQEISPQHWTRSGRRRLPLREGRGVARCRTNPSGRWSPPLPSAPIRRPPSIAGCPHRFALGDLPEGDLGRSKSPIRGRLGARR